MKRAILAIITILCFGIFAYNNTYAVDDVVYNLDTQTSVPFYICNDDNASSPHCSDYDYIVISADNAFNGNAYETLIGGTGNFRIPVFGYAVIQIKDSFSSYGLFFNSIGHSFRLTLTNTIQGDCPEPPAPDCPDPSENSQFINVVLDAFWKYHTVFAGAVASLIAIFVVYRIIKGMLR